MLPFPTLTDAMAAGRVILSKVTGGEVPLSDLLWSGGILLGFAGSQFQAAPSPINMAAEAPLSDEDFKGHLESFCNQSNGMQFGPGIWIAIAAKLIELLLKWRSN